jgi:hypothetical protein
MGHSKIQTTFDVYGHRLPNRRFLALQQKTPLRGGGALLGLLQGGEICISIYVDPWEVGEPCYAVGRPSWEATGAMDTARDSTKKSFVSVCIVSSMRILEQRTNIRAICV